MKNILEEILEVKKEEVRRLRRDHSISRFRDSRFFNSESISFLDKINAVDRISIIAEIKAFFSNRTGEHLKKFDGFIHKKNFEAV